MSTCRIVQPVSSGGSPPVRGGRANWRRLIGATCRASGPLGEHVQGAAERAQQVSVGVRGDGPFQGEQGLPVGVGVDERRGHEVGEDAAGRASRPTRRPAAATQVAQLVRRRSGAAPGRRRPSGRPALTRAACAWANRPASARARTTARRCATRRLSTPAGGEGAGDVGEGARRVVDDLEDAVAVDEVDAAAPGRAGPGSTESPCTASRLRAASRSPRRGRAVPARRGRRGWGRRP